MRAFAFWGLAIHYIAYLDEFGHIGPYISRIHAQHNTSPVFGLGGLLLPASKVRAFSTWFYQLKGQLLNFEIERAGVPAYRWEKKGSAHFTTTNVLRYPELRKATFRLLNRIESSVTRVLSFTLESRRLIALNETAPRKCTVRFCAKRSRGLINTARQESQAFISCSTNRKTISDTSWWRKRQDRCSARPGEL